MKKELVAMLLAGGQGSRLYALTQHVAKPAVPFGGKYRIIDFPLSNCVNSGIDTVGVLTQYQPLELNAYIGNGQPWDLDRSDGGVHILPPYVQEGDKGTWYKGTANAIYQNMGFLELYDPEYVLILSGDHIYKMDYDEMLAHHKKTGAACTISVLEVTTEEASRFGIMNVDDKDQIYEFEEKPKHPKSNLASMGIYIFTWSKLKEYLMADEADEKSKNDFGHDIIPSMLDRGEIMSAYRFSGYWKDVGTIDSLWDANMDMLSIQSGVQLFDNSWTIYARSPTRPPHYTGENAKITHSLVTGGCEIYGDVENSVLFHSVIVEEGAHVRYSILMPGAVVKAGAVVEYSIVAEQAVIGENARVGTPPDPTNEDWGITVIAGDIKVGPDALVPAHAMVTKNVKGVAKK
ncbi:MAG: glucose-1-phosphate adenylyltransferase [Oscillospiraceae bacterium]